MCVIIVQCNTNSFTFYYILKNYCYTKKYSFCLINTYLLRFIGIGIYNYILIIIYHTVYFISWRTYSNFNISARISVDKTFCMPE